MRVDAGVPHLSANELLGLDDYLVAAMGELNDSLGTRLRLPRNMTPSSAWLMSSATRLKPSSPAGHLSGDFAIHCSSTSVALASSLRVSAIGRELDTMALI